MKQKQNGFSIIEVIIVLTVVCVVAAVGFMVLNKQKKADPDGKSTQHAAQRSNWSTMTEGPYLDKISYATSPDLLNWTNSGHTIGEHISVPDIMNKDGKLFMYFVDVTTDGKSEQLGLKTSANQGVTWSDTTIITINGAEGVLPVDSAPFLLPDGRVRLYYFDNSKVLSPGQHGDNSIKSAISQDGVTFTQEAGDRFTRQNVLDPDVVKVGDTWRMYLGTSQERDIITATSKDGLNFTYEGVALEDASVPEVYHDGNRYILYTSGVDIAFSDDGKTFAPSSHTYQPEPGVRAGAPGVIKLGDGSYLMVHTINTSEVDKNIPAGN